MSVTSPPLRPPARLPPRELLGLALQGVRGHRLRAALSALGIAIGIGAMVAVVSVSASAQANLLAEIDALGTNLLTVTPGQTLRGRERGAARTSVAMIDHMRDVDERRRRLPGAERERVPHAVRARAGDAAGSGSTRPARTCPGCSRRASPRGTSSTGSRNASPRSCSAPKRRARCRSRASSATSSSTSAARGSASSASSSRCCSTPSLDSTVFISLPVAERLFALGAEPLRDLRPRQRQRRQPRRDPPRPDRRPPERRRGPGRPPDGRTRGPGRREGAVHHASSSASAPSPCSWARSASRTSW